MDLPLVRFASYALNPALRLHTAKRYHGCRLCHTDPLRELTLRQAVLLPNDAQHVPSAQGDAERLNARRNLPLHNPI